MLLYSEFLYSVYLNSGKFFNLFIYALAFYSFLNWSTFKGEYVILKYFFSGMSVFELLFHLLTLNFGMNTNFLNHYYAFFTLILCSIFYQKILQNKKTDLLFIVFAVAYIIVSVIQIINTQGNIENPFALPILNILFILTSIMVHIRLIKSKKIKSLSLEPLFWLNLGFLIINLSQLLLKPIFNSFSDISDDLAFVLGTFKNLISPITYTLWAIGVYKLKTQPFRPIASLWP